MTTNRWHKSTAAIGLALFVIASFLLGRSSHGNPPVPALQEKSRPTPAKLYYGVAACSNGGCHNNPKNPNQTDIILCEYDEVQKWSNQDKHRLANIVLQKERAKQIGQLLGIKGDISKEPSCVSCHGVLVENDNLIHKPSFDLREGVNCAICHGPFRDWVAKHSDFLERENWRALSRRVKEEQFGMRDLWDPEKRATLCVSCHIGNTKEGKVVTHAMYAAGHPPLPGIECATFSDAMPRHWKYLSEKSAKVQQILEYDPAKVGLEKTQFAVIAGLVSFRESINLLASQAEQSDDPKSAGKSWPEFSMFDCYACHHDLKSKSWRQERGYNATPGRPEMRAWPLALIPLGIIQAAQGNSDQIKKLTNEMQQKIQKLTAAFDSRPFGDPKLVAQAARDASQWADDLLQRIKPTTFERIDAHYFLQSLGKMPKDRLVDFDTARQITWTFRLIQDELDPKFSNNVETIPILKDLDGQLKLELLKGQQEIAKDYLKDALEKLNNFEPEKFRTTFDKLIKKIETRSK